MKLVSIVVPMYNEAPVIDNYFRTMREVLGDASAKKGVRFEIIAVNDGSGDGTLDKLRQWQKEINCLSVLSLSRNFGQEPAVFAGLERARGDAAIVMDCDLQDPPEMILPMIEKWEKGYDVVNCRRVSRKSDTRFKRDTAGLYYAILNKLSHKVKYPHNVNNFRLVSRRMLDLILAMPEKQKFYRGLVAYCGFKSYDLEIERKQRAEGESKYNFKAMVRLAVDGIASTSTKPLSWALGFGIFFLGLGALSSIALLVLYLLGIGLNYTLFGILSGLSFFTGILLVFLGIVGIYLGKAFEEIKGRPFAIEEAFYPAKERQEGESR